MTSTTHEGYDELAEISQEEIERYSKAGLPLFIPWHPDKTIPLGTLFFSNKPEDPWAKNSPFNERSLTSIPMIVSRDYGSQSIFKSQSTSNSTQTQDHLELGFGIGVGLPFVASVTVAGNYCKDVQENKDKNKTSINMSMRAGVVSFEKQPKLSTEAIITIKYNGGLPAFHERYGDYYLAAYRLGGDTGILVSGASSDKKKMEKFGITVTVEVLFVETSVTHTENFLTADASSKFKIIGYDTLGHTKYNSVVDGKGAIQSEVQRQAEDYCTKAKTLDIRVSDKLDELDVHEGDRVDSKMCQELTKSGLIVELMLLPVITLREVQNWVIEDDVI